MAEKVTSLAVVNVVKQLEQVTAIYKEAQKLKILFSVKERFSTFSTLLEEYDVQEHEPDDWLTKVRDVAYETQESIDSIVVEPNYKFKLSSFRSREKVAKHHVEEMEKIVNKTESILSFKKDKVVGFGDAQETLVIGDANTQLDEVLYPNKRICSSKILEGYDPPKGCKELNLDLELCWLYFGLFPDNKSISAEQMIQMWMAEGLLKKKGSKEAEEIGEECLKELIDQDFIQIAADESVKKCRASSSKSQFLIPRGASAKFFEVHMNNNLKPNTDIRMKAIHGESVESVTDVLKTFEHCSVKSLHCFGKNSDSTPIPSEGFWETLLNHFPQLRVLNLGCLVLDKVPKELGKLKHLRYLRLRVPNAKHLPSFIVNLQQLETLDMRESCCSINLPHGIWKMQFLRHLYLGAFSYLPKTSGSPLSNLQTISGVYTDKNLKWLMVRAKFPNVRKLRICSFDSDLTCNFLNSLDHLYHLQSLRVEKSTKLPPDLNAFPLSLTKLTLLETELQPECFKTLEKLPNLRILKLLEKAISGEEIACSAGGFLQLEVLYVEKLIVKNWIMGNGAMQCLKCIFIKECNDDILKKSLNNLKEVKIFIYVNGTERQEFVEDEQFSGKDEVLHSSSTNGQKSKEKFYTSVCSNVILNY